MELYADIGKVNDRSIVFFIVHGSLNVVLGARYNAFIARYNFFIVKYNVKTLSGSIIWLNFVRYKNSMIMDTNVQNIERRTFLGTGIISLSSLLLPSFTSEGAVVESHNNQDTDAEENPVQVTAFLGEAGMYKQNDHFVMGMLSCQQEQINENALKSIRETLNYKTKLNFRSADKYKVPFCEAIITYFVTTPGIQFTAKVYHWDGVNDDLSFGQRTLEKIDFFSDLETKIASKPQKSYIKSHSPFGPSIFFKDKCKEKVKHDVVPVNTRMSNLLQLAGLLTGCVYRELRGPGKNKTKAAVIQILKSKLNVSSLEVGTNVSNKFQVIL